MGIRRTDIQDNFREGQNKWHSKDGLYGSVDVDAEVHQGGANLGGIALNGEPETEITIVIVVLTVYVDA
jgi:hypothetical protein